MSRENWHLSDMRTMICFLYDFIRGAYDDQLPNESEREKAKAQPSGNTVWLYLRQLQDKPDWPMSYVNHSAGSCQTKWSRHLQTHLHEMDGISPHKFLYIYAKFRIRLGAQTIRRIESDFPRYQMEWREGVLTEYKKISINESAVRTVKQENEDDSMDGMPKQKEMKSEVKEGKEKDSVKGGKNEREKKSAVKRENREESMDEGKKQRERKSVVDNEKKSEISRSNLRGSMNGEKNEGEMSEVKNEKRGQKRSRETGGGAVIVFANLIPSEKRQDDFDRVIVYPLSPRRGPARQRTAKVKVEDVEEEEEKEDLAETQPLEGDIQSINQNAVGTHGVNEEKEMKEVEEDELAGQPESTVGRRDAVMGRDENGREDLDEGAEKVHSVPSVSTVRIVSAADSDRYEPPFKMPRLHLQPIQQPQQPQRLPPSRVAHPGFGSKEKVEFCRRMRLMAMVPGKRAQVVLHERKKAVNAALLNSPIPPAKKSPTSTPKKSPTAARKKSPAAARRKSTGKARKSAADAAVAARGGESKHPAAAAKSLGENLQPGASAASGVEAVQPTAAAAVAAGGEENVQPSKESESKGVEEGGELVLSAKKLAKLIDRSKSLRALAETKVDGLELLTEDVKDLSQWTTIINSVVDSETTGVVARLASEVVAEEENEAREEKERALRAMIVWARMCSEAVDIFEDDDFWE